MGTMIFKLPPNLPADAREELERASVAGGQDAMPYPTQVLLDGDLMILTRQVDESGNLMTPWNVDGAGKIMLASATLMERLVPYHLAVELARGKINQLRSQASDWLMGGLVLADGLAEDIRQATLSFGRAVAYGPAPDAYVHACEALAKGCRAGEGLVDAYRDQVFAVRHSHQNRLDTQMGCRLGPSPLNEDHAAALEEAFNTLWLPMAWRDLEPSEDRFCWEPLDQLVNWALQKGFQVVGGPLVDFTGRGLPDWLWEKETDLLSLCGFLSDYVSMVVERYHRQVRVWQLTAGSNCAGVLALGDEELLWLTIRLAEAARRIDPSVEIVVGLAQPWGDYLAHQERSQSPFVFTDTLVRTGLKLSALDLELVLGVAPRGSYCRDLLEISRVLDLYALLGLPLQVTLGYPSAAGKDDLACSDQRVGAGFWCDGHTPMAQADWAAAVAGLCLCKPFVRAVQWVHYRDSEPHHFPHCGLVDMEGKLKPALKNLTALRGAHLK
ncbi:MAG: endo-1,4-beta-xylanase [Planctomycetes bacterium]|nr:endo-1,4-beta-xylanase [Planctomycetota bacterium]